MPPSPRSTPAPPSGERRSLAPLPPGKRGRSSRLGHFFALCWVEVFLLCLGYLGGVAFTPARAGLFAGSVLVTYPLIYLLPALLITWLASVLTRRGEHRRWRETLVLGVAALTTTGTLAFLLLDAQIFRLYGYHVNGFVINLLTTRGGIESLGMSSSAVYFASGGLVAIVGLQALLYWIAGRIRGRGILGIVSGVSYRACLLVLLLLSAAERTTYGMSHVKADFPILVNADAFPLYSRLTFDGLAQRLGFEVNRERGLTVDPDLRNLDYPLEPLIIEEPAHPLNVVWLVAESWRWDTLDPEIMPETSAFADRAWNFLEHYSGGNGTRMGVFSMFYGLYAPYWFPILIERRGPALMEALLEQDYQLSMYTSARFTYPEFDQTVFADVGSDHLTECAEGQGWQRDRKNVESLLGFINGRDRSRPFMTFLFFESPHARYYFPEESVIREPYLDDFNYATMNLERDIDLIHNRYLNSCRHLDSQFGRILDYLERESLLEDTIVVLTGDHGEEFMEKGRWGHGSTFVEEQIRVPLVIWMPGTPGGRVERMTSHVDLPATIMPRLGVRNDPERLSLGFDLFGPKVRTYSVIGDWSRICYVGLKTKASFPFNTKGLFRNDTTNRDDSPLEEDEESALRRQRALSEILRDLGRFRRK